MWGLACFPSNGDVMHSPTNHREVVHFMKIMFSYKRKQGLELSGLYQFMAEDPKLYPGVP